MEYNRINEDTIQESNDFIKRSIGQREWLSIDEAEKLWIEGVKTLFKEIRMNHE